MENYEWRSLAGSLANRSAPEAVTVAGWVGIPITVLTQGGVIVRTGIGPLISIVALAAMPSSSRADEKAPLPPPPAYNSPREVFDAYREALDKQDWRTAYFCGSSAESVGDLCRAVGQRLDFLRDGSGVQWVGAERLPWRSKPPRQRGVIDAPFGPAIPCRVASQQSPTPFHRATVSITIKPS
jgi:hypothetical protein